MYFSFNYLLWIQDEEDIAEALRNSDEYRELLKMKQIRSLKAKETETGAISHPGYQVSKNWFLMHLWYPVKNTLQVFLIFPGVKGNAEPPWMANQ